MFFKDEQRVDEIKAPDPRSDDLSLIPGNYMMKGENQLSRGVVWLPQIGYGAYTYRHTPNKVTN